MYYRWYPDVVPKYLQCGDRSRPSDKEVAGHVMMRRFLPHNKNLLTTTSCPSTGRVEVVADCSSQQERWHQVEQHGQRAGWPAEWDHGWIVMKEDHCCITLQRALLHASRASVADEHHLQMRALTNCPRYGYTPCIYRPQPFPMSDLELTGWSIST